MQGVEKIAAATSYAHLAELLHKLHFSPAGAQSIAVADSMGLWHIFPGKAVAAEKKGFKPIGKASRIAFTGSLSADALSNWKIILPWLNVKLEALDLKERLGRLHLISAAESKLASGAQKKTQQKMRREFEEKIQFFNRYAHDLKTPLSMLTIPVENLILNDGSVPAKIRLQLEKIKTAIYTVLRTVGYSLDAARLMTAKRATILTPYDFSLFVRHVVEVYAIVFESYGIRLETEIQAEIVAEIDAIQMEKVLNNLLNNAVKHNLPGGTTKVILAANRKQITLTVEDGGLGVALDMPPKHTGQGVNPWVFSSHGFGLEIVRALMRQNRGKIKILTDTVKGTTAIITLPARPELAESIRSMRQHNFYFTMHEVELLASERTTLSRRRNPRSSS